MTYPNVDLQSLPQVIDLRVGSDPVERALQLSYWQVQAALWAINNINTSGQYPEAVVNAGDESSFDTSIDNLQADLVAAMVHYEEIWAYVP